MMDCSTLLCDEQLALSPPSSPLTDPPSVTDPELGLMTQQRQQVDTISCTDTPVSSTSNSTTAEADSQERDDAFRTLLMKQAEYAPAAGYVDVLHRKPTLQGLRFAAVKWVITARGRLNLSHATAFLAVNYLDRFVSLYPNMEWECWMMELLSVSCLSIAAKFEELNIPSLHAFPMDDLSHSYQPSTIQRMELLVLRALDWRLCSVTPHTYVDFLTWKAGQVLPCHLVAPLAARVVELLLGALLDSRLVGCFSQLAVAVAAVKRALEEIAPSRAQLALLLADISSHIPPHHREEIDTCGKAMEDRVGDPMYASTAKWSRCCPSSPVTVIGPMQKRCRLQGRSQEIPDSSVDLELFFDATNGSSSSSSASATATCNRKRRRRT